MATVLRKSSSAIVISPPKPSDEDKRLAALRKLQVITVDFESLTHLNITYERSLTPKMRMYLTESPNVSRD